MAPCRGPASSVMFSVTAGKFSYSPRQMPVIAPLRPLPLASIIPATTKMTAKPSRKMVKRLITVACECMCNLLPGNRSPAAFAAPAFGLEPRSLSAEQQAEPMQMAAPVRAAVLPVANCLIAGLGAFGPGSQVLFLFGRELIDLDAHGLQLEPGHFFIQLFRHGINLALQRLVVLD